MGDRSNDPRDFPVEHVYLARPKLAKAVLEWWRHRRQLLAAVQQWNDGHPGVPDLQLWHAADSHDLSVVGFRADESNAEPPPGLSGTAFWEPVDGPAGDRWRDLLATAPGPAEVDDLLWTFGVGVLEIGGWEAGREVTYELAPPLRIDEISAQVYLACPVSLPANPHLIEISMSEWNRRVRQRD